MEPGTEKSDNSSAREPIRKPWIWIVLVFLILVGVPWYWPSGTIQPLVLGVPLWALIAMASTVLLAAYLSWLCRTQWDLVGDDEDNAGDVPRGDSAGEGPA